MSYTQLKKAKRAIANLSSDELDELCTNVESPLVQQLLKQRTELSRMVVVLKDKLEKNEHLTIVYDKDIVDLTEKVDVEDANRALASLKTAADADFNLLWALMDLRRTIDQVDAIATSCTLTDLPKKMAGYDELLAALTTRALNAADAAGRLETTRATIGNTATARIAGIINIKHDGGESLHKVISEISFDFKSEAEALFSKQRQGRKVEPRTKRCYEHALTFYVNSEETRTWEQAGHACFDWLITQGLKLDKTDRDLKGEMEQLSNAERGNILSSCYHNYRRNL